MLVIGSASYRSSNHSLVRLQRAAPHRSIDCNHKGICQIIQERVTIMKEMIAYCGLVCTSCPQFIATQNDDDIAREKAAKRIAEKFGLYFKPEEINCDGCLSSGGRLIGFCNTCEIRKCGITKSVENCSTCDAQPCDKLMKFHDFSPDAKASFEALVNKNV
jgi:hypothetical protein